jgi:general secretion pathway protein J
MMARRHRGFGFTLVEMLVSLFVFSLLATAGVAVMAFTVDNRDGVSDRLQRLGELQRASALLRQDLSQAAPRRVRDGRGQAARSAFVGAPEGIGNPLLAFTRRGWENPEQLPRASMQHVAWRLVDDRLERLAMPALDGATPGPAQVVLDGVSELRLAYRHRGQWSPAWPGGPASVPDAIELRMQVEGVGELRQVFVLAGQQP